MTKSQTQLYWRSWALVVAAHDWRMEAGRLVGQRQEIWQGCDLNALYQDVWECAEHLASHGQRSVAADDLRHACTVIATGHQVSSRHMTNEQFDRVLALFRLLADPNNLNHMLAWENAEAGERRRQLHVITRNAPAAYVRAIARDKFGTSVLEDLNLKQLRELALTIRMRWKRKAEHQPPAAPAIASHAERVPDRQGDRHGDNS